MYHQPLELLQSISINQHKMKSAIVHVGPKVTVEDVPIPKPEPKQVLIKVIYSGSNPKDWKVPEWGVFGPPKNEGNDIAGIVEAVGEEVTEFRRGDRVAAFLNSPGGGYAEYAAAEASTTFFLPAKTTFQGQQCP
jgi:NADPH2:quinone reductase